MNPRWPGTVRATVWSMPHSVGSAAPSSHRRILTRAPSARTRTRTHSPVGHAPVVRASIVWVQLIASSSRNDSPGVAVLICPAR